MGVAVNAFMHKFELLYHSQKISNARAWSVIDLRNTDSLIKIPPRRAGDRIMAPRLFKLDSARRSKTTHEEASHSPLGPPRSVGRLL